MSNSGTPEAAAALYGDVGVDDGAVIQEEQLDGGVGDQSFDGLITDVDNCIDDTNWIGQKEKKVGFYPNGIPDHALIGQPRVPRPELGSGLSPTIQDQEVEKESLTPDQLNDLKQKTAKAAREWENNNPEMSMQFKVKPKALTLDTTLADDQLDYEAEVPSDMETDESPLVIHHDQDDLFEPPPHSQEKDMITGGSPVGLAATVGSVPAVPAMPVVAPSAGGGVEGRSTAGNVPAEVQAEIPSWVPLGTQKFVKMHIPRCMLTVGKKTLPRPSAPAETVGRRALQYSVLKIPNKAYRQVFIGGSSKQIPAEMANQHLDGKFGGAPDFNSDPRSSSTLTEGSNRKGVAQNTLCAGLDTGYTFSASAAGRNLSCLCCFGAPVAGYHNIDGSKPVVFVLADGFAPPVLGGGGSCAVVLRVDQGSPEQMKLAVKKFFASKFQTKPKKSARTSPVPPGSVFLISLNSWMRMVGLSSYLSEITRFIGWLERYVVLGYDTPSAGGPGLDPEYQRRISDHRVHCVLVSAPYCGIEPRIASISSAISQVETIAHASAEQPLLGLVSSSFDAFMQKVGKQKINVFIESQFYPVPSYSGEKDRFVRTNAVQTCVPGGLALEDMTPQLLFDFWGMVMDRTRRFVCDAAGNQNASNVPSSTNLLSGLRDTQSRGIKLDTTFPRVSFPPPPGMVGQGPVEVRTIFVIGNSNARAIAVSLEELVESGDFNFKVENASFSGGRANESSMQSMGKALAKKAKKGDIVLLDGMCNVLLTHGDRNVVQDADPLTLVKDKTPSKSVIHLAAKTEFSFEKMKISSLDHIDLSIRCIADFCKQMEKGQIKVIVLGPLPRFPIKCCVKLDHGLVRGQSCDNLNRLIRDLNSFVAKSSLFNSKGVKCGLPFETAVPDAVGPWSGSGIVRPDNVHPFGKHIRALASSVLEIVPNLLNGWSWVPTIPASVTFKEWLPRYRQAHGASDGADGELQIVDVVEPLWDDRVGPGKRPGEPVTGPGGKSAKKSVRARLGRGGAVQHGQRAHADLRQEGGGRGAYSRPALFGRGGMPRQDHPGPSGRGVGHPGPAHRGRGAQSGRGKPDYRRWGKKGRK